MGENMVLYWGSGSPPCWKVMITLEEKNLSGYESHLVSFAKKEHKSEEVLKINPRGQMPTFKDGDVVVNESQAVCLYLESRYSDKGTKLIPDAPKEKALVYQRMFEVQNLISAIQEKLIQYTFTTKPEDQNQTMLEERYVKAREELATWDKHIKENGEGGFVAGKIFTMADVFLYPVLAIGVRMGLKLEKYSALASYYKRVTDRPSVQSSWPPHWKEGPGKDNLSAV